MLNIMSTSGKPQFDIRFPFANRVVSNRKPKLVESLLSPSQSMPAHVLIANFEPNLCASEPAQIVEKRQQILMSELKLRPPKTDPSSQKPLCRDDGASHAGSTHPCAVGWRCGTNRMRATSFCQLGFVPHMRAASSLDYGN
jgi:hypothetical protein